MLDADNSRVDLTASAVGGDAYETGVQIQHVQVPQPIEINIGRAGESRGEHRYGSGWGYPEHVVRTLVGDVKISGAVDIRSLRTRQTLPGG